MFDRKLWKGKPPSAATQAGSSPGEEPTAAETTEPVYEDDEEDDEDGAETNDFHVPAPDTAVSDARRAIEAIERLEQERAGLASDVAGMRTLEAAQTRELEQASGLIEELDAQLVVRSDLAAKAAEQEGRADGLAAELRQARDEIHEAKAEQAKADDMLAEVRAEAEALRESAAEHESALATSAISLAELEGRVAGLRDEVAASEARVAELAKDNGNLRAECEQRDDNLKQAAADQAEMRRTLSESGGRVLDLEKSLAAALAKPPEDTEKLATLAAENETLADRGRQMQERLDEALAHIRDVERQNRQLETELEETGRVQEELLLRQAKREAEVARAPESGPAPVEADDGNAAQYEREMDVARSVIASLEAQCETNAARTSELQDELAALRLLIRKLDPRVVAKLREQLKR